MLFSPNNITYKEKDGIGILSLFYISDNFFRKKSVSAIKNIAPGSPDK
jgi:hypothetical protein